MQKKRKIPLRKCLGCRQMKPKKELIRIVRNSDGEILIDFNGKVSGRGAYICDNKECFNKVYQGRNIEKAFSQAVDSKVYMELEERFKNYDEAN